MEEPGLRLKVLGSREGSGQRICPKKGSIQGVCVEFRVYPHGDDMEGKFSVPGLSVLVLGFLPGTHMEAHIASFQGTVISKVPVPHWESIQQGLIFATVAGVCCIDGSGRFLKTLNMSLGTSGDDSRVLPQHADQQLFAA